MKAQWLVLPLVGLWPAYALAQTPTRPSAPKVSAPVVVEPAAQALLDRAIQNYRGASGLSYRLRRAFYGPKGQRPPYVYLTNYSRPGKITIVGQGRRDSSKIIADGRNLYEVSGDEYDKTPISDRGVGIMMGSRSKAGELIAAMMEGLNPITQSPSIISGALKSGTVVALEPRVIDGEVLQGIRYTLSLGEAFTEKELKEAPEMRGYREETTAWFAGTPLLLRRVQERTIEKDRVITSSESVYDQQLSPTFAADTFKWDATGLKPAVKRDPNQPYWDARLKVGTSPFAFSTQDLQGRPVSLDKYKGKVLLLDFWATWCGPCVEGLPEVQSAYAKYHPRGLEAVSISLDENKEALTSFLKEHKMPWSQVFDGQGWKGKAPTLYGVQAIPFLLLIGKDGKIAAVNPRGDIDKAVKAALAKG